MMLCEVLWHFHLCSVEDKRIIPLIIDVLPYLKQIARTDAALYYEYKDTSKISQGLIKRYLLKHREYDVIEISKVVESWRKAYGTNERASDGNK
jgi:hypothetical protein